MPHTTVTLKALTLSLRSSNGRVDVDVSLLTVQQVFPACWPRAEVLGWARPRPPRPSPPGLEGPRGIPGWVEKLGPQNTTPRSELSFSFFCSGSWPFAARVGLLCPCLPPREADAFPCRLSCLTWDVVSDSGGCRNAGALAGF